MEEDKEQCFRSSAFSPDCPPSPISHQRFTIMLAYGTAACMSFTIFFAYNGCLNQPIVESMILERPERAIVILNILSQLTIFLLAELTSSIFDITRWALASTSAGIPAFTFLVLSRATTMFGVVSLLMAKAVKMSEFQRDGHRFWGIQRYVQA